MSDLLGPGALAPDPGSAPAVTRVLAQARFDARIMLRNGEQVLLTLVLPALVLVALTVLPFPDLGDGPRIDVVAPGVLALAVMSTAFTGQAITTGFDRRYGVLRLLATTPLGREGLLAGRLGAVLVVESVQVVVLSGIALAMGWRPVAAGVPIAFVVLIVGTATFVTLGLLLAGTLRAEAVLATANLVWVLLLAGGGVVVPPEQMGALAGLAQVLPSGALGNAMRAALMDGQVDLAAFGVLVVWGVVAGLATVRLFRWD